MEQLASSGPLGAVNIVSPARRVKKQFKDFFPSVSPDILNVPDLNMRALARTPRDQLTENKSENSAARYCTVANVSYCSVGVYRAQSFQ